MAGNEKRLAGMMDRRNVDILCLQKTKWKGSKTRNIGVGCKQFYNRSDGRRSGIGIVMKEELVESILEVKSVSHRIMAMKLEIRRLIDTEHSKRVCTTGWQQHEREMDFRGVTGNRTDIACRLD